MRSEVKEIVVQEAIEPNPNLATTRTAHTTIRKVEREKGSSLTQTAEREGGL